MLCFKVQYVKGEELLKALRGFGNGFGEVVGRLNRGVVSNSLLGTHHLS